MTVEAAVPKTIFPTIAGTGPYAIGWPYGGTDVIVTVVDDGVRTVLAGADFSLSPASSDTSGSVFLSPAAAALYAGAQLIAERSTPEEQGWTGVYPGEKGIEAQLDRTTRRIQEISRNQQGTLRIDGTTEPGSVATDRLLLWDGTKIVPGPTAAEIPAAEGYAEEARAWAIEAEDVEVETGLFSAFHWAQKAADSAAAAAVFDPILYARKDQNLNDLPSKPTARTNLGLGNGDAVAFGSLSRGAPITKTANFTLAATENHIINNKTGSACVVTLPAASGATGREVMITNAQAQAVNSASSNVVPLGGGAAGAAILPALIGAFAVLVSDGTSWRVTQRGLNPTAVGEALAMAASQAAARAAIAAASQTFWNYISSQQTVTLTSTLTLAHGLAGTPSDLVLYLICTIADAPYVVGEILLAPMSSQLGGSEYGSNISADGTNVYVRTGTNISVNTAVGAAKNLTVANWRYIAKARL